MVLCLGLGFRDWGLRFRASGSRAWGLSGLRALGLGIRAWIQGLGFSDITPRMENHLEKKVEDEMETRVI